MRLSSDAIKNWSETGKNLVAALRDAFLLVMLLLLVGCPQQLNKQLAAAGLTELEGPGFKWKPKVEEAQRQVLAAGAAVEQTKAQTAATLQKIDAIVAAQPALKAEVAPLRAEVAQAAQSLAAADTKLLKTATTQQNLLSAADANSNSLTGWMYLGSVDQSKKRWMTNKTDAQLPVQPGVTARVVDSTYIRTKGPSNARASAPVLGVAPLNAFVRIEEVDSTGHLRAGGWTVWARVTLQP